MWTAIARYGARVLPETQPILAAAAQRGQLVRGPHIEAFEKAFAARVGAPSARAVSYGRMAFYHLLKAFDLPRGSEIVFPALTFWVVPELARAAGLVPVFADVDPETFTLDPESLAHVITERTRAVVPTHLWGLPCDMDPIMAIARQHGLIVIEDCAHALGADYRGQPVGTIGDAGFFSLQTLKPLNTHGGGMAVARDPRLMRRVSARIDALPPPSPAGLAKRLRFGRLQRNIIRKGPFTCTLWPLMWLASWPRLNVDVYLWEKIRPLDPLPPDYLERYSNAQAALGLAALDHLDRWTRATQAHAARLDGRLAGEPGVRRPARPNNRTHVFYQYCAYVTDRDTVARRALRRGVDIETLHVDVCTRLPLFAECPRDACTGAERAADAVQLPVYESLTDHDIDRVGDVIAAATRAPAGAPIHTHRPQGRIS
ncbi:MAG: aminotransferase class I/II-fold pyridoxal phosphate-dependent enzyme [Acidobacteriota bacterium]